MSRDALTPRQRSVLLWCVLLSPLFRAVPTAGRGAWLTPLLCLPAAVPLGWGIGALSRRVQRSPWRRCAAVIFGLWCLFYGGFVLRAGADRFVSAIYPESPVWVFVVVMALLLLPAGLGRLRTLGRFAEAAAPVLGGVFALVLVFSLQLLDPAALWPLSGEDLRRAFTEAPSFVNLLSVGVYLAFLPSEAGDEGRSSQIWPLTALCVLGALLRAATVGSFGAALAGRMNYPFFVLLRNLRLFHLLERAEALVAGQWVVMDFLLAAALLRLALDALHAPGSDVSPRLVGACVGAMLLAGLLCAPSTFALRTLGERWIPRGHLLALVFLCLSLIPWKKKAAAS